MVPPRSPQGEGGGMRRGGGYRSGSRTESLPSGAPVVADIGSGLRVHGVRAHSAFSSCPSRRGEPRLCGARASGVGMRAGGWATLAALVGPSGLAQERRGVWKGLSPFDFRQGHRG